jgi:hypothetical protein
MAEEMTTVLPIVGFAAAAHPSGVGLLVIKHLPGIAPVGATPAQLEKSIVSRQYGIRAEQCTLLAQDLLALADKLHAAKAALN